METYEIHPISPQRRYIEKAAHILNREGGLCIYPTDTVYGLGASVSNPKAIDKVGQLLNKDKSKLFSFICEDFSQVSEYAKVDNQSFKILKHYLPGPFTFLLPATNYVPKKVCPKRKIIGIRIPDNQVCLELVKAVGVPLANTSLELPGEDRGNPDNFDNAISNNVDIMLHTGPLDEPYGSTIIDLTSGTPELIREGKGVWNG